jgi:hypothetical protein
LVEKWIPPTRSETAWIGKKTKGILGVKLIKFKVGFTNYKYFIIQLIQAGTLIHTKIICSS